MALALLEGEAIGVDVGIGNDFVDESHSRRGVGWRMGGGLQRLGPKAIIPSRTPTGKRATPCPGADPAAGGEAAVLRPAPSIRADQQANATAPWLSPRPRTHGSARGRATVAENQGAVVGGHRLIGQGLKAKAEGPLAHLLGIAQPHGWIKAAQVGIESGIAGCRGHATAKEGAIEQQQAAGHQHPRRAGQQLRHRGRSHDVGGVGAEHCLVRPPRPLISSVHIQLQRFGQVGSGGQACPTLQDDPFPEIGEVFDPVAGLPLQASQRADEMQGVLAAAGAHLQHPRARRQPLAQHLQDRLLVAFAGLGTTHVQERDTGAILTGPSSQNALGSGI